MEEDQVRDEHQDQYCSESAHDGRPSWQIKQD
jgi:hypothetical protein